MTRTAYAQLLGQRFHPPKAFGVWKEREASPEWKWRDVGMKIVCFLPVLLWSSPDRVQPQACGFEMLYQESKSRMDSINAEATSSVSAGYGNPCLT
jgi:hypothetical protein